MILCCEQGGFCKSQGVASRSGVGGTVTPGASPEQGPGLGGCFPSPTKASSEQCLISLVLMKPIRKICPVKWHGGFLQPALSGCPWAGRRAGDRSLQRMLSQGQVTLVGLILVASCRVNPAWFGGQGLAVVDLAGD